MSDIYSALKKENPNSTPDGIRNDDLKTKLLVPGLKEDPNFAGYGEQSRAKWLYVYDNGLIRDIADTELSGTPVPKIIGRYAYQVLPQTSRSRLSLYAVTAGAKGIAGYTGTAVDRKIPHKHRWGADVDELLIPGLKDRSSGSENGLFSYFWGKDNPADNESPQYELDNFFNLFSSTASPNHLSQDDDLTKNYKGWLRNIFAEGKERLAREAYTDNGSPANWYPRFNLGRFNNGENWYERFIKGSETVDTVKNNSTIVDRLTRHPGVVIDNLDGALSPKFQYVDGYLDDSRYDPFGLPFLRRIGNNSEKGAFDSVENLRKQIAANLNDYCDDDDIPTSNVPAADWKSLITEVDNKDRLPAYTGNEKTPYINEMAFGFKLDKASIGVDGKTYKFKAKLHAEVIGEIINIYKDLYKGKGISEAKIYGNLKSLKVWVNVRAIGDAVVYPEKADGTKDEENKRSFHFTADTSKDEEKATFEFGAQDFIIPMVVALEKGGPGANGPYWIGHQTIEGIDGAADLTRSMLKNNGDYWYDKDDNVNHKVHSIESVKLTNLNVQISKVEFEFSNLVLGVTPTGVTTESMVDFVRVSAGKRNVELGGEENHNFFEGKALTVREGHTIPSPEGQLEDLTKDFSDGFAYVGAMQVLDPRQNLYFLEPKDNNDWASGKGVSFEKVILSNSEKPSWKTENVNRKTGIASRMAGKVNDYSSPKAPQKAAGGSIGDGDKDPEGTDDPAWQGDDKDKHISTAVIRNAPMRSPWELGFIHRGIPFQTINLKKAGGIDGNDTLDEKAHDAGEFSDWTNENGTKYEHGDAGILDQIKMTEYNKSYGKVDLESLAVAQPWWAVSGTDPEVKEMNLALFKSLFNKIRRQEAYQFLAESVEDNKVYTDAGALTGTPYIIPADLAVPTVVTSILRSKILNTDAAKWVFTTDTTDAAQEELVGKTFNLIEGKSFTPPSVFRVVIVAQTIRDLEGSISRWDLNVTPNVLRQPATGAKLSVFDYDSANKIYYDEILSECRMLVTVEKIHYMEGNTPRARLRVKQIEYLD